jgi:peptidylprolyl isomerase
MLNQLLSASAESQLQANMPLDDQETGYWDQGCAAGYLAVKDSLPPDSEMTVVGAYNAAPDVTIPAQPAAPSLYIKTLIPGTGPKLTSSEGLVGNYVTYDWSGTTSKLISSSYQQGSPSLFVGQLLPGLEKALIGQRVGSRVLAVLPPSEAFGSVGNSQEGVGPDDSLVFVIDMDSAFATASVPGTQTSTGGGALPTVTPPAADSTTGPTITIPANATPPDTLQAKPLIKGTGPVVKTGDDIAIQYTGVSWQTGEVFNSSWASGTPFTMVTGAGQVIKGLDDGQVGQTVGSRVLLVVPPADGYGSAGSPAAGIDGNDTLVFVVDILAALQAIGTKFIPNVCWILRHPAITFRGVGERRSRQAPRVQSWHTNRAPNARGCASPRPSLPAAGKAPSGSFALASHTPREPKVAQYGDLNQLDPMSVPNVETQSQRGTGGTANAGTARLAQRPPPPRPGRSRGCPRQACRRLTTAADPVGPRGPEGGVLQIPEDRPGARGQARNGAAQASRGKARTRASRNSRQARRQDR